MTGLERCLIAAACLLGAWAGATILIVLDRQFAHQRATRRP